jgi:PAP2 superfamily
MRHWGFDWLTWFRFVSQHPALKLLLSVAYFSLMLQIVVSIIYFSHIERSDRNCELWWNAMLSLLITAGLSALLPAAGASVLFGVPEVASTTYLPHFLAIRDGSISSFPLETMQGIVTFPSYHTVLAVLLTYAYRGQGRILLLTGF